MTTYVQNTWVDQDVERPRTYEVNTNQDGSITLIDSFGVVTELGTPVNATNMNHIEGGIAKLYEGVVLYDAAQTFTNKSIVFFIDENNNVKVYRSLVNNNTGNPLTSAEYWEEIKLGGGSAGGVGSVQWSLLPQTDAGLHLLDGALIQGNGIYREFVQYIADLYTNNPTANYFTTEANWQTSVSTYGVCGKFVYDSTNNTVRLPKVTGFIEGTIDPNALGDLVEAGLPNISGHVNMVNGGGDASGAFNYGWAGAQINATVVGGSNGFSFDASRSNSIYGNSNTVQPQAIKGFLYIVVANSTKTEIQVDIDNIVADLNTKADINLTNINQTGKNNIMAWGMPDYANGVSKTSNTTYTAEVSGLLYLYSQGGDVSRVYNTLVIDGETFENRHDNSGYTGYYSNTLIMYVEKGSTYKPTCTTCTFYPLKGAN